MSQAYTRQLSARLLLIHDELRSSLLAFLPAIQAITNDDTMSFDTDVTDIEFQLLLFDPFKVTYNHSNINHSFLILNTYATICQTFTYIIPTTISFTSSII